MRQIVYVSTAAVLPEGEVDRILETAVRRNLQTDITGFLLYNGRNFLQLIEGEQAALLSLMSRLARDPRHSGILVLVDAPIQTRCCPDWHMHRIHLAEDLKDRRLKLAGQLPFGIENYPKTLVHNFAALN